MSSNCTSEPYEDSDLILDYHDAVIYGSDLKLLTTPTAWLNDAVIHFYFTWLSQEQLCRRKQKSTFNDYFMEPSVASFWMHQCVEEDEIEEFLSNVPFPKQRTPSSSQQPESVEGGRIFVAVNDNMSVESNWQSPRAGNHWSLLVIHVSTESVDYWHFDSVRHSGNDQAARDIAAKFQTHVYPSLSSRVPVVPANTPQQCNGYDCGLHVLGATKLFASIPHCQGKECLERELNDAVGNDPVDFCFKLRQEIATKIHQWSKK
jgi:sentrin-specific protease 8